MNKIKESKTYLLIAFLMGAFWLSYYGIIVGDSIPIVFSGFLGAAGVYARFIMKDKDYKEMKEEKAK